MNILGIDPGPDYFAWAIYDTKRNEIRAWGRHDVCAGRPELPLGVDAIAIEDIVAVYIPNRGRTDTVKTIGMLEAWFPEAILISRERVRTVLTGTARGTEARANAALSKFIPTFRHRRTGLTGHHRAAACVAFVAGGQLQARKINQVCS